MPQDDQAAGPPPLTLADLRACGYQDALAVAADAQYGGLADLLHTAARAGHAAGEPAKGRALALLAQICSMRLTPADLAAPFKPMMWIEGRRSMIPEDLSDTDIGLLADLAPEVDHVLLRARLADLVWWKARKRGILYARMAIDAYRQHPIDSESWHLGGSDCWHRALQLALQLGAGAEHRAGEIVTALMDAFDRSVSADGYEPLWYVRPLYATGAASGLAQRIATQLAELARARLAADHASEAEAFFSEAAQWYGRGGGMGEERADMLAGAASCWAAQAEANGSAIARHHFYEKAIAAYRDVPAKFRAKHAIDATIDQLRAALAAAGQMLMAEMHTFVSQPVDLTDVATSAEEHVQGKTPIDALFAFCELHPFPDMAAHVKDAGEQVADSLIGNLFASKSFSEDGRAVAKREGAAAGEAAHAARVQAEAIKSALMTMAMTSRGMITPALDAMQLECHLTPRDFFEVVRHSPLVPRDRSDVVAKGLYAGYCSDYIQAVHILLPQFEHMVRSELKQAGAHTTTIDPEGIEMEAGLSTLIDRPQMVEVFGDDLTFTIRALMCDQEGPNLRNAVAHGLADSTLCESDYGVYAWWLVLRLVTRAFYAMHLAPSSGQPSGK